MPKCEICGSAKTWRVGYSNGVSRIYCRECASDAITSGFLSISLGEADEEESTAVCLGWTGGSWKPHQRCALDAYETGMYLAKGVEPSSDYMQTPIDLDLFEGSIAITGAVGIGKSSLCDAALFDNCTKIYQGKHIQVHSVKNSKPSLIVAVSDFSSYIEQCLRDISENAHFHAAVFYRECYEEIWKFSHENTTPWMILWDRFPLENIIFADSATRFSSALLFEEFWPTEAMLTSLKSLRPSVTVFPIWSADDLTFDYKKRSEMVLKRARCDFEREHATDDFTWFYKGAWELYRGSHRMILPLNQYAGAVTQFWGVLAATLLSKQFLKIRDDNRLECRRCRAGMDIAMAKQHLCRVSFP